MGLLLRIGSLVCVATAVNKSDASTAVPLLLTMSPASATLAIKGDASSVVVRFLKWQPFFVTLALTGSAKP